MDDSGIFVKKPFELNPRRGACVFNAVARLALEARAFVLRADFRRTPPVRSHSPD